MIEENTLKRVYIFLGIFFLAVFPLLATDSYSLSTRDIKEGKLPIDPFNPSFSDTVSIDESGKILAIGPEGTAFIDVVIPSVINGITVTEIGDGVFKGLADLESVEIAETVKIIGKEAFANCKNLVSVKLPTTLSSLGEGAFSGDKALMSINLPVSLKTVSKACFKNCTSLKEINIPSSVTKIEEEAFAHCSSLVSVSLTNTRYLGDKAFMDCYSLSTISISASLLTVGPYTFYKAPIKEIIYPGTTEEFKAKQNSFFRTMLNATITCRDGKISVKS